MQTADALHFWANHPGGAEWLEGYDASSQDPPRDWACQEVMAFGAESVLEIGCHCGPLLRRLSELGTIPRVLGIDANGEAVAYAKTQGLEAIVGIVPEALKRWPTRIVDVVVSSYCLSYIAPPDLPWALSECLRVAKLGMVIVEPMAGPGVDEAVYEDNSYVEWRHDYLNALDAARILLPFNTQLNMRRIRKDPPHKDVNAVVVVRTTWMMGL